MRVFYQLVIAVAILLFSGCSSECDNNSLCQPIVINSEFQDLWSPVGVNDPILEGDCLSLTLAIGGCDGDGHPVEFSIFPESNIANDTVICQLKDLKPELCNAVFYEDYEFDLSLIRENNDHETIVIGFNNSDEYILY